MVFASLLSGCGKKEEPKKKMEFIEVSSDYFGMYNGKQFDLNMTGQEVLDTYLAADGWEYGYMDYQYKTVFVNSQFPDMNLSVSCLAPYESRRKGILESDIVNQNTYLYEVESLNLDTEKCDAFKWGDISIGDTKDEVDKKLGTKNSTEMNDYGTTVWYNLKDKDDSSRCAYMTCEFSGKDTGYKLRKVSMHLQTDEETKEQHDKLKEKVDAMSDPGVYNIFGIEKDSAYFQETVKTTDGYDVKLEYNIGSLCNPTDGIDIYKWSTPEYDFDLSKGLLSSVWSSGKKYSFWFYDVEKYYSMNIFNDMFPVGMADMRPIQKVAETQEEYSDENFQYKYHGTYTDVSGRNWYFVEKAFKGETTGFYDLVVIPEQSIKNGTSYHNFYILVECANHKYYDEKIMENYAKSTIEEMIVFK